MSSTARLGAFIVVALTMFGIIVFLVGDKQFLFNRTYSLSAAFDNVVGLQEGAPVRAGGVNVGAVKQVNLPSRPDEQVVVLMGLENSTREVIKKDSIASIETEGLLGNRYVAISFGSPDAEQVRDGDTIGSSPPVDYSDVAKRANDLLETAKEAIDTSKVSIGNINEATDDMKSITGKIDSGQGTIGALLNDPSAYRQLNATLGQAQAGVNAFHEDMEALKHNWFFKGFFKDRGWFDSTELTTYAIATLPKREPVKQFTFDGNELFDKPETAKLRKGKILNKAGSFLEKAPFDLAVVVARSGLDGPKSKDLTVPRARAMVVRRYLTDKFKLQPSQIRTLAVADSQQVPTGRGGIAVMVYAGAYAGDQHAVAQDRKGSKR